MTYLFISHNLAVVKSICDHMAVMYLGKIMECGSTQAIYRNTLHPYTQALLSAVLDIDMDNKGWWGIGGCRAGADATSTKDTDPNRFSYFAGIFDGDNHKIYNFALADTAEIDGGLILRCGPVETNCSLSMLLSENRRETEAKVSRILFAEREQTD